MKLLSSAAFALVCALPLAGCFETIAGPYDGPTVVEFDQVSGRYSAAVASGSGAVGLTVNLIGPQQGADVTVGVMVIDSTTTAIEGTDYTFPNGAQVTIPANSSSGTFTINVEPGLAAGVRRTLAMELGSSADGSIEGAENLDDFVLTIVGV